MEKDRAKELYEKAPLTTKFVSYYKYSFSFAGENEFISAGFSFGGNADDIYRENVNTEDVKEPATFEGLLEKYVWVKITEKATGETYELYDY